jgi:hypothetical protein
VHRLRGQRVVGDERPEHGRLRSGVLAWADAGRRGRSWLTDLVHTGDRGRRPQCAPVHRRVPGGAAQHHVAALAALDGDRVIVHAGSAASASAILRSRVWSRMVPPGSRYRTAGRLAPVLAAIGQRRLQLRLGRRAQLVALERVRRPGQGLAHRCNALGVGDTTIAERPRAPARGWRRRRPLRPRQLARLDAPAEDRPADQADRDRRRPERQAGRGARRRLRCRSRGPSDPARRRGRHSGRRRCRGPRSGRPDAPRRGGVAIQAARGSRRARRRTPRSAPSVPANRATPTWWVSDRGSCCFTSGVDPASRGCGRPGLAASAPPCDRT